MSIPPTKVAQAAAQEELNREAARGSLPDFIKYLKDINLDFANTPAAHHNLIIEPLRLYRRLQILSGLEHEQIKTIFPGDTGAGCSDGLRT